MKILTALAVTLSAIWLFDLAAAFEFPQTPFLSRREAFLTGGGLASLFWSAPSFAMTPEEVSSFSLRSLIPRMTLGAPATNVTVPSALASEIEALAAALESRFDMRNIATSPNLSGSWRLLYSNGAEITNLAAGGLPLGFALGPTYQPLDTGTGRFENRGMVVNRLAKLQSIVVGDINVAKPGTLNTVGVSNDKGNRVDVDFKCIIFQLDEVLGVRVNPPLRKTLVPKLDTKAAQPANDITYLDETTRIIRGGDGALFILQREDSGIPMLTNAERDLLYQGNSSRNVADVVVGAARMDDSTSPELKFLFKESGR
jgi:hypothetical protein